MDLRKQVKQLEAMLKAKLVSKKAIAERIEMIKNQFPDFDITKYQEILKGYEPLSDREVSKIYRI